ncbi:hypothetical protein [Actinophytocola sediminis]
MSATITLDDTLYAIVQLTHEQGLPLHGVDVRAGAVTVRTETADARWWVRWLTDSVSTGVRPVVWDVEDGSAVQVVYATRAGIEWCVVERVPTEVAGRVLAAHGMTLSTKHQFLPAAVAVALADELAADALAVAS